MTDMTYTDYVYEIDSIANNMVEEAMADNDNDRRAAENDINDSRLHETIDGHQWIIYTAYNMEVLQHSNNKDAYDWYFGGDDAGHVIKERGIDGLHTVMAYCAMEADVRDRLDAAFEAYEDVHAEP